MGILRSRSSNREDREWLVGEIAKRAPWYQRIEFPEYGLATTDRPEWVVADPAWDNLFPGMLPADAPRLRPLPKYDRLRALIPPVAGKTVLEVGTSCGFFAFEFARMGAKLVTGIDIGEGAISRARFCAGVLGMDQVHFAVADLGHYREAHDIVWGSSLHEHFFFPFYYLARLLCLARESLVLETHHYVRDDGERVTRLDVNPDGTGHRGAHAFHFSRRMYLDYLAMLGIDSAQIEERVFYDDGNVRRLLLCVDTRVFQKTRDDHGYLTALADIR